MIPFSILLWQKPGWRTSLAAAGTAVFSILLVEGLLWIPAVEETLRRYPSLSVPVALIFLLAFVVLCSRPMVRIAWKTRQLEAGELRKRLEALARRAGLEVPGIRILGGRRMANGFVVGLTRRTLCVVLTEHLLQAFPPAKVEAVFAHELGHARGKHLHYLFLLMATFLLLSYPLVKFSWECSPWMGLSVFPAFTLLYWRFLFGRISRHFELEADRTGAELIGPNGYRDALSSGQESLRTSARSFRHPPLEDRLREIDHYLEDGSHRISSSIKSTVLRRRLAVLFFLSLALFGAVLAGELAGGAA